MKNLGILLAFVLFTTGHIFAQVQGIKPAKKIFRLNDIQQIQNGEKLKSKNFKSGPPRSCPGSNIVIANSSGFSGQALAAIEYAIEIWEKYISSSVNITIDIEMVPLGFTGSTPILGAASPVIMAINGNKFPLTDVYYPVALGNSFAGVDLYPGLSDISAYFNSDAPFYFGLDGNPPADEVDFVSVVFHEIGHGLGFLGSADSDGTPAGTELQSGIDHPFIWDTFIKNGQGTPIINYQNGTAALLAQLIGGDLFFEGPNALSGNGNSPVEVYAPSPFDDSSFSHLDKDQFPDFIMGPSIGYGVAIQELSNLEEGILEDLGWETPECTYFVDRFQSLPIMGNSYYTLVFANVFVPEGATVKIVRTGIHEEIDGTPLLIKKNMIIKPNFTTGNAVIQ